MWPHEETIIWIQHGHRARLTCVSSDKNSLICGKLGRNALPDYEDIIDCSPPEENDKIHTYIHRPPLDGIRERNRIRVERLGSYLEIVNQREMHSADWEYDVHPWLAQVRICSCPPFHHDRHPFPRVGHTAWPNIDTDQTLKNGAYSMLTVSPSLGITIQLPLSEWIAVLFRMSGKSVSGMLSTTPQM